MAKLQRLDFPYTVQGVPESAAPSCYSGIEHVVLRRGIFGSKGALGGLTDDLAAAVALAWRLPRAVRVDLEAHGCTLLLPARSAGARGLARPGSAAVLPPLRHCFAVLGAAGDAASEAAVWARLLRPDRAVALPPRDRAAWATKVSQARSAACAVAGASARAFVAHAADTAEDTRKLLGDLSLLTSLQDLTVVWWSCRVAAGTGGRGGPRAKVAAAAAGRDRGVAALEGAVGAEPRPQDALESVRAACGGAVEVREVCVEAGRASGAKSGAFAWPLAARPRASPAPVPAAPPRPPPRWPSQLRHGAQAPSRRTPRPTAVGAGSGAAAGDSLRGMRFAGFGTPDCVWGYLRSRG